MKKPNLALSDPTFVVDLEWKKVGPPNRYSYEVLKSKNLPHSLERFLDLFQSKAMFSLLQKYTDLDLTTPVASMKLELQKWTPGNYSVSQKIYRQKQK